MKPVFTTTPEQQNPPQIALSAWQNRRSRPADQPKQSANSVGRTASLGRWSADYQLKARNRPAQPSDRVTIVFSTETGHNDYNYNCLMCHGYCQRGKRGRTRDESSPKVDHGVYSTHCCSPLATSRLADGCVIWAGEMLIRVLRIPFGPFSISQSCYRAVGSWLFGFLGVPALLELGSAPLYCDPRVTMSWCDNLRSVDDWAVFSYLDTRMNPFLTCISTSL